MNSEQKTTRRSLLKLAGATAGLAAIGGAAAEGAESCCKVPCFKNDDFHDTDGKFDLEKGKDAVMAMLKYHGYPIFDGLREDLWVSDYGLGRFAEVGLAAYIFMNQQEACYLQLDIYLLPNQMLPEHYHLETPIAKPKMEGWLCRHGRSYVYGEGEKTEKMHAKIPSYQKKGVTVFHETIIDPGQCAHLNRPTARHWQFAGPEGAILTEVGTFHDGDGVRHTDPNIVFP